MSTQAEAFEYRIRRLERELAEARREAASLRETLACEHAARRRLEKDRAKLEKIKNLLRT